MKNCGKPGYKAVTEKLDNNIEFLDTDTNNKNFKIINNFRIFNKKNKFEEEFAVENKNSNNCFIKRTSFNQIKLCNPNIKNGMFKTVYSNKEIRTKSNSNININNNKDFIFCINDFVNKEAVPIFKNNNSSNLNQFIVRNFDDIKIKTINQNANEHIDNLDIESNKKSEERYLMTNKQIINNCTNVVGTLDKRNSSYSAEDINNITKKNKGLMIINQDNAAIEENKNNRNSIIRGEYKNFLINDNIKLMKNISAVLKSQENVYKFIESKFCPIISKNFEREKNRANKFLAFSANPSKRINLIKRQNSILNKIDAVKQQNKNLKWEKGDEEIKNIKEENRQIPRKLKTSNYTNRRDTNLINVNNPKEDTKINNKNKLLNDTNKGNFISEIKRIYKSENHDKKNNFLITNLNKFAINKAKEETEFVNKRSIFTPDVNYRNKFNIDKNEIQIDHNFPTRTILKTIKNEENLINNNSCNLKNSDYSHKNKKNKEHFESVKDQKICFHNKNLSSDFEFINVATKYELTKQETEKDMISKHEFNSLFKAKNEPNDKIERNSEKFDSIDKEDKGNSFIDIIISKTNSNKKLYDNENNKRENFNFLTDKKIINNLNSHHVSRINDVKREALSRVKSENKEYNNIFDPIEKELNFSRNSSENKEENNIDNDVDKRICWNLFKGKSKSNFDKNEPFKFKESLNLKIQYKVKSNENLIMHKYSNCRPNVFSSSVPRIVNNKSASNFFSKNKIFSYIENDKLRNAKFNSENLKFSDSLNVKKVHFIFNRKSKKGKIPEILNNKEINKTTLILKNKK